MAKIIEKVAKELGFSIQFMDLGDCIYYRINDVYDLEIRGHWARKNKDIRVWVWDISDGLESGAKVVESHCYIKDVETLKIIIADIQSEYENKPHMEMDRYFQHKQILHA